MKTVLSAAFLGFAAASEGGTLKLTWSDCGDSSTHGHITSLTPATVKLGTKTTLAGKGTVDEAITDASYKVSAKAGGVPVFSHSGDACGPDTIKLPLGLGEIDFKGFSCPISPGAVELDLDLTLAAAIPSSMAKVAISLTAAATSGDKALCVNINTGPALDAITDPEWDAYKSEYGRNYLTSQEEAFRHSVFTANMAEAAARNKIEELADFGANEWSDWTEEEFSSLLGYIPEEVSIPEAPRMTVTQIPTAKDWTNTATTPVKNQGHCGSCWAFSATEQIESDYILQHGKKVVLAPQELVDCKGDKSQRNGCKGGNTVPAYKAIEQLGGIEAETDYPYTHKNGQCRFQAPKEKVKVTGYQSVGKGDEAEMKKYVGSTGPLSVCGHAKSWQHYKGGILTTCASGGGHCFQIVGYGEDKGVSYWKVRNSWGTGFGENGFIRIQIGENLCNINGNPSKVSTASADDTIVV